MTSLPKTTSSIRRTIPLFRTHGVAWLKATSVGRYFLHFSTINIGKGIWCSIYFLNESTDTRSNYAGFRGSNFMDGLSTARSNKETKRIKRDGHSQNYASHEGCRRASTRGFEWSFAPFFESSPGTGSKKRTLEAIYDC